jgi:predicted 2-oxoglutarate/Fe(II)-dependent dioxygenase YbiX
MRPSLIPNKTCFLIEGAFGGEECRAFIARAEREGYTPTGTTYPPSYRDNDRLLLDDARLARSLFERLRCALPERSIDAGGASWALEGLNTRFRSCRYRNGQSFEVHRDGAFAPSEDLRSRLTVMLYLNDAAEFAGGSTRFKSARAQDASTLAVVEPKAGTAIVFDHDLWHEGEPVSGGTKYVLRTDVMYRALESPRIPHRSSTRGEEARLLGHRGYVLALCWLADGRLVTGSRDRSLRIWSRDDAGWRCASTIELPRSVTALAQGADGSIWAGGRDGTISVFASDGSHLLDRAAHDGAVLTLRRLDDGRMASGGGDGRIRLWSTALQTASVLEGHTRWVWSLGCWKTTLISGSEDGTARVWDTKSARCTRVIASETAVCAALIDAGRVVLGGADGSLRVIDARGSERVIPQHRDRITSLAPFESWVASASDDGTIALWDPTSDRTDRIPAHGDFVRGLDSRQGLLASCSYDGTAALWRIRSDRGDLCPSRRTE